jgi:hypothetical protein
MELKYIGWFSDLPYGDAEPPTLRESLEKVTEQDRAGVAAYLDSGAVVTGSTGRDTTDAIAADGTVIGPLLVLTDGRFVWPSDLSYYVRNYGADVGAELLATARANRTAPTLTTQEVQAVAAAMVS